MYICLRGEETVKLNLKKDLIVWLELLRKRNNLHLIIGFLTFYFLR